MLKKCLIPGLIYFDPFHKPDLWHAPTSLSPMLLTFATLSLCLLGVLVQIGCLLSARSKGTTDGLEQRINLRMRTFKNLDEYIDIDV